MDWLKDLWGNHAARWTVMGMVALPCLGVAVLVVFVSHCSAIGGRCPAEIGPLWESDTFRFVAALVGVAVTALSLAANPRPNPARSLLFSIPVGLLCGLLAVVIAAG